MAKLDEVNAAQVERLKFIEFRLRFIGFLKRADLIGSFGVKQAAATRDIALYRELAESNIVYDSQEKTYRIADSFSGLFGFEPEQVLTMLSSGARYVSSVGGKAPILCERSAVFNLPKLEVISALSRAIATGCAVRIEYNSITSGKTKRDIVPFALIDTGVRWHVRAYDRRRKRFSDFVLTRIRSPQLLADEVHEDETKEQDIQWNRIVPLELVAHPKNERPEVIELDYGMEEGMLRVNIRASLAGYLLRLWGVDCSQDFNLDPLSHHLWLKNWKALYGASNLAIAPGYKE